jgi:hypothetical protein
MPIISDRPQHAPQQQSPYRSSAAGSSFAERIEAGSSARQVTQERALGFSETGLLGLHYAHDLSIKKVSQSGKQRASFITHQVIAADELQACPGSAIFVATDIDIPTGQGSFFPTNHADVNLNLAKSSPNPVPTNALFELMTFDAADQPDALRPAILKSFQKAILQSGSDSRLALTIVETPQGISVHCDDKIVCSDSIEEFAELALQIAKDFGVTIRSLVVTRNTSKF